MPQRDVVEDRGAGAPAESADNGEHLTAQQNAIKRAADGERGRRLYTPSVLEAAVRSLTAVQDALSQYRIDDTPQFPAYSGSFAAQVLAAHTHTYMTDSFDEYLEEEIDPVALVDAAIRAAAEHLGRPLEPTDGPALSPRGRAVFGYAVLPRQPESPAWGDCGDEALVLSLGRQDQHALRIVYSSGGGWPGPYEPGPWAWYLGHTIPHDICMNETHVITRAPSLETAAEVGAIAAEILIGAQPLPR